MAIENKMLTFGTDKIGTIGGNKLIGFPPPPPITLGSIAWYKADNVIKDISDRVSQWNDDSGNNRHLTQATGGSQPLWEASYINSKPTVNFDSVHVKRFLTNSFGLDLTGSFDIFIVGFMNSGGGNFPYFVAGTPITKRIDFGWYSNNIRASNEASAVVTNINVKAQTLPFASARLMQINFNTTNSKYYENGVQIGGAFNLGASHILAGIAMGSGYDFTDGSRLNGRISEVVYFNKTLTSYERNLMNDYLNFKYGL